MHVRELTIYTSITRFVGPYHRFAGRRLGHAPPMGGDDTPAALASHPDAAMVEAALEFMTPFQPADASSDTSAPIALALASGRWPMRHTPTWHSRDDPRKAWRASVVVSCTPFCAKRRVACVSNIIK